MSETHMTPAGATIHAKVGTLAGMAAAVAAIAALGWGSGTGFAAVGDDVYQDVGNDVYQTVGDDVYQTVGDDVYQDVGSDVYGSIDDILDVNADTPHYADLKWIVESGVSTGYPDRTFRPYTTTKRCDMAAFLFRMGKRWGLVDETWQPDASEAEAFADVTESTAHAREIQWLASEGISGGWERTDGQKDFRPYANVKRQDMAAFLFRLASKANKGGATEGWVAPADAQGKFRDVSATDASNHHDEVWWLASTGVSEGWSVGGSYEFRGANDIARCDMAAFIHRVNLL